MTVRYALLSGALLAACHTSDARAADISGEVGLVSDYRYRGLSLSRRRPAAQASITAEFDSGLYLNGWASSIEDAGTGIGAEIDLTAGVERQLSDAVTWDVSTTYYLYPDDSGANYVEANASLELTHGRASASFGLNFVPPQRATRGEGGKHSNSYAYGELGYEMPGLPLSLSASLGYEHGYFDDAPGGGKWDWSLTGEVTSGKARFSLGYVGCGPAGVKSHALVGSLFFDL